MTRSLAFIIQAALVSAAAIDSKILSRQGPTQVPASAPALSPPPFLLNPPKNVKVFSRVEKPATIRPKEAKRVRVSYGPFDLLAKDAQKTPGQKTSLDPNGQSENFLISDGLCTDCTVLGGNIMLTDEKGNTVGPKEGVYTHHFISLDVNKDTMAIPIAKCATGESRPPGMMDLPDGQRSPVSAFIGRGEDGGAVDYMYTSVSGPIDFGYHIRKDDKIMVNADLVNYRGDQRKLWITYEIEYVEGIRGADTTGGLLSVGGCNPFMKPNINPNGRSETISKQHSVLADTTIVAARGHLHPGGEKMQLLVNDKIQCESMAEYDDKGYISAMTLCPKPIALKKGDNVSMVSVYDVKKHPLRPGAEHSDTFAESAVGGGPDIMGMFIVTFGETK